jgi:hypothetical protein
MRIEMSDTISEMKLIHVDNLTPDQLMIEDLIKFGDDIVEVLGIESDKAGDVYHVGYQNEFGEKDVAEFFYTDLISLYVFIDEE